MQRPFTFQLLGQDSGGRAGIISTPHGDIATPAFAPVGTQAAVKAVTPAQLLECNVSLILANTYHLYLRPGDALIAEMGGLHRFMSWPKPILTDSGGFQVFSLAETRTIDDDGVTFKSHLDGSYHRFTPESAISIQQNLGADIMMAFDECPHPYGWETNEKAVVRTHLWAERCLRVKSRQDQALFGIVQGGVYPDLRQKSAEGLIALNFDGYAIGGLSVGETKAETYRTIQIVNAILPENKPRYLMGVGTPEDLIQAIIRGVDMFDCVAPTRLARHKTAFLHKGRLNLMRAEYKNDPRPIDESCHCYTCRNFSRAYLRHLILAKETLVGTLLSIHNIHILIQITQEIREAILNKRLTAWLENWKK